MQPAHPTRRRRARDTAATAAVVLALLAGAAPAALAAADHRPAFTASRGEALDRRALDRRLDAVRDAGMTGAYGAVRDGRAGWTGATGLADTATGRPTTPDLRHRIGSVTKTFTAVAVLQQSAEGRIRLDAPAGDYLPGLLPGERGRKVTVRMLLNHTSGIADYVTEAFPSFKEGSPRSLDELRHRTILPAELIGYGTALPQLFEPGAAWSYSNTNYILLGELLRAVTGQDPEKLITEDVIRKAGLRSTYFPGTDARIKGPHARMYENLHGLLDPPRDYSEYNMTWGGTAAALVSTTRDLNTFYRALFQGRLLPGAQLREMRTTVPVTTPDGQVVIRYGLGVYAVDTSCGPVWGHNGGIFGAGTESLSSADGERQYTVGFNLMKYQRFDDNGAPVPHPVDTALYELREQALCGGVPAARSAAPQLRPEPAPLSLPWPLSPPHTPPQAAGQPAR